MPQVVYRIPQLYDALKAEGYTLPDECGDITMELPVDGMPRLVFRVNVDDKLMAIIGRAFLRLAEGRVLGGNAPTSLVAHVPDDVCSKRGIHQRRECKRTGESDLSTALTAKALTTP